MDGKLRSMCSFFLLQGDKVLLLYRQGSRVVNDVWIGAAGGHMEPEEVGDAKACALRELGEEIGLTEADLENVALRYMMVRNTGTELRLNYYFFADLKKEEGFVPESNEGINRWFTADQVEELPMPASTKQAVLHYFREGRNTTHVYAGLRVGEGIEFTALPET